MNFYFIIFLMLLFFWPNCLFAQEKFEQEKRIAASEVPSLARQSIEQCSFNKKIKWYQESSQDGTTYEAKTKYQKHRYSIEFSKDGDLLDIEKTINFLKINATIKQTLQKSFDQKFKSYKIIKTQAQFKTSNSNLSAKIFEIAKKEITPKIYEIVIKAKEQSDWQSYEILIDSNGKILRQSKIIERNTDNLEF